MAVTYTNRCGQTFTLCRRTTRKRRPRYVFVMTPRPDDPLVPRLPDGYTVHESVQGRVTLRPQHAYRPIRSDEIAWVRGFLQQRPYLRCCRVEDRGPTLVFFEPDGISYDDRLRRELSGHADQPWPVDPRRARYQAVLRFRLVVPASRIFAADRMHFSARIDGWWNLDRSATLAELTHELVPHLMRTSFYYLAPW